MPAIKNYNTPSSGRKFFENKNNLILTWVMLPCIAALSLNNCILGEELPDALAKEDKQMYSQLSNNHLLMSLLHKLKFSHLVFTDIIPDRTEKLCVLPHGINVSLNSPEFLIYNMLVQ